MGRPKKGEMSNTAWWEVRDDDDGDGPYWYGYSEGDKDGDRLDDGQPLILDPGHFPVGTRIDVSNPWDEAFYDRLLGDHAAGAGPRSVTHFGVMSEFGRCRPMSESEYEYWMRHPLPSGWSILSPRPSGKNIGKEGG